MVPTLILASQSTARRQLLTSAGFSFRVEPSYFDEDQIESSDPVDLVKTLAWRKAEVIAARHSDPVIVIGADSILWLNGQAQGKPESPEVAWDRLQEMRGQIGELYTGMALVDTRKRETLVHYDLTRVFFARPTDAEIRAYIATGEPLYCAGCFALEGYGGLFVERIEGCHSNVIGLSLPLLRRMLIELGYSVTDFWQQSDPA